jgi:hypothetical protein
MVLGIQKNRRGGGSNFRPARPLALERFLEMALSKKYKSVYSDCIIQYNRILGKIDRNEVDEIGSDFRELINLTEDWMNRIDRLGVCLGEHNYRSCLEGLSYYYLQFSFIWGNAIHLYKHCMQTLENS